jgi:hypothetical protein
VEINVSAFNFEESFCKGSVAWDYFDNAMQCNAIMLCLYTFTATSTNLNTIYSTVLSIFVFITTTIAIYDYSC